MHGKFRSTDKVRFIVLKIVFDRKRIEIKNHRTENDYENGKRNELDSSSF